MATLDEVFLIDNISLIILNYLLTRDKMLSDLK